MKVRDLMERIRLHEIALPEFQREYVWEVEQAQKLLKSPQGCIYVAVDDGGDLVGLAMGGPADRDWADAWCGRWQQTWRRRA